MLGMDERGRGRGVMADFKREYLRDFTFAFIGIGIFRFWYQYNLYNLHSTTDWGIGVAWSNILRGAVGILLVLCALRGELKPRTRSALVWGSLVLMTASAIFNFLEIVTVDSSFETARYVTCGVGLVWGGGMWMDFFARLKPTRAFLYLVCGLALSCLLSLVAGYLSPVAMGLVNLFVPAFSVLAFWQAMRRLDERDRGCPPEAQTDFRYSELHKLDVHQIGIAFTLFAFVLGITLGLPDGHPRELGQLPRTVHQLSLVAVLAGVLFWVFARGGAFRFSGVWYLENAILITAIVLLVEDYDATRTIATVLFLTAESFFYSFVFLTCYDIGRRTRRTGIFILGVFYSCALAAMGAGRLLSTRVAELPGGMATVLVLMSALVVVEMVMALHLDIFKGDIPLFSEVRAAYFAPGSGARRGPGEVARAKVAEGSGETFEASGAEKAEKAGKAIRGAAGDAEGARSTELADPVVLRVRELAEEAGFTQVEAQIALLVVRGRSRSFIAQELGYSENTVRNYARSLYAKLGVHSKQELISMVEDGGR